MFEGDCDGVRACDGVTDGVWDCVRDCEGVTDGVGEKLGV